MAPVTEAADPVEETQLRQLIQLRKLNQNTLHKQAMRSQGQPDKDGWNYMLKIVNTNLLEI